MISYFQAVVLGLVQGVAEPFPVSSLGHGVIIPRLAGWNIQQNDKYFLTFLVATHLATAIVLLLFFLRDWIRILGGLVRLVRTRTLDPADTDARLAWLVVVGTVPAGILGLALEHKLRDVFKSAPSAAAFLIVNGLVLLGAEALRRRAPAPEAEQPADDPESDRRIASTFSPRGAFGVGVAQALALIPGFSRSGVTMGGGLLAGLSNEDAARFSFLLATPIIGAAALLKLPDFFKADAAHLRGPAAVGALCAAFTTFLAVKFLLRFFETNRLTPFAYYCLGAGGICTVLFATGAA